MHNQLYRKSKSLYLNLKVSVWKLISNMLSVLSEKHLIIKSNIETKSFNDKASNNNL